MSKGMTQVVVAGGSAKESATARSGPLMDNLLTLSFSTFCNQRISKLHRDVIQPLGCSSGLLHQRCLSRLHLLLL
jgi:hypothetical protein